jgi:hypothetical protein
MALREPVRSSATSRVLRQTFWLCLILASLHLLSISARSQITLVRILKDQVEQKAPTTEVYCIRKNQRPPVRAKMALEIGDELYSESRSIRLEVNCGGATYLFTAPLSVVFRKPTSKGCFTVYSSDGGRVNVISRKTPTKNKAGLNEVISNQTEYEIRMFRKKRSWLWRLLLFRIPRFELVQALSYEGEVTVTSPQFSETVKQGQKVTLSTRGVPIIERLTPGDFLGAARVYAEFDVSQMSTTDPGERQRAFHKLITLHEAVLRKPENSQSRIELNRELKNLGIPQGDVTPSPSPPIQTPPAKEAGSQSNEWTKADFEVRNRCKKTHEFRITPKGLQFPHRPLSVEITVLKGATYTGRFEFDMTAVGPGVYDGEWFMECLDCQRERRCVPVEQHWPFKLKK